MSFIIIEGIDRSGKSTQTRMLVDKLTKCGLLTEMFSFPNYDSLTGKFISEHLHNQVFLLEKDILLGVQRSCGRRSTYDALVFQCAQTCDKYAMTPKIMDVLHKGNVVVCDRWWQSAFVYGLDDGLDLQWLKDVHSCLPQADLNLLLDLSPDEAAARRKTPDFPRSWNASVLLDRYECDLPKQQRLRDSYLQLWKDREKLQGQSVWKVLSVNTTPEEVHERIVDCVKNYLAYLSGMAIR